MPYIENLPPVCYENKGGKINNEVEGSSYVAKHTHIKELLLLNTYSFLTIKWTQNLGNSSIQKQTILQSESKSCQELQQISTPTPNCIAESFKFENKAGLWHTCKCTQMEWLTFFKLQNGKKKEAKANWGGTGLLTARWYWHLRKDSAS